LPRWCYGGGWLSFAAAGHALIDDAARDAAADELALILDGLARPDALDDHDATLEAHVTGADDRVAWGELVDAIVGEIAAGRLEKAVAARRLRVAAAAPLDDLAVVRRLAAAAPGCTTFAFRREASTFLGATPERLITRRGRRVVAEALAGTIAVGGAEALLGSDKDLREHFIVVRAIADALAPFCVRVEHPTVPEVHTLRDMLHLRTPVVGELARPTHILTLVEALHPTPAVGGVPREAALRLLAAAEVPRGWYAAPIGWFDARGDGELCVALRCGVVAGSDAVAYAGAGIVAGSDAEREHAETALKLRALLGALGVAA
jgi:isochorismate synthase